MEFSELARAGGEERAELLCGFLDRHLPARLQLTAKLEEKSSDLGSRVEFALDPRKRAATLPESALLARTPLGVTVGDELESAERPVLVGSVHEATVHERAWPAHRFGR